MTIPVQSTGNLFAGLKTTENSLKSPLDMDAFLNMFLAQLKNQDPTNPLESYELASQLAQFSTVERLSEINKNMVQQLDALNAINYSQMAQMVGKDVVGQDDGIQFYEGQTSTSSYDLQASANVTVNILSEDGTLVKRIPLGVQESGTHHVDWDGTNDSGQTVMEGRYRVYIEAVDGEGNSIPVENKASGAVHAFRLINGKPYLVLGHEKGLCLPIAAVRQVSEGAG